MKMSAKFVTRFVLPLLLISASGCATKALWNNENLEACKEPAGNLNLRLFDAKKKNHLLVVYNEYSERSDGVHTRAYWLNQNQAREDQRRSPHFASTNLMRRLPPVPVFFSTPGETNRTFAQYAVVETNRQSLTLYSTEGEISRHDLPTYNDGKGRVEKIAMTPISVTADLTIVAGILGYMYLESIGESGGDAWMFNR
jgi:hypothetical protein